MMRWLKRMQPALSAGCMNILLNFKVKDVISNERGAHQ